MVIAKILNKKKYFVFLHLIFHVIIFLNLVYIFMEDQDFSSCNSPQLIKPKIKPAKLFVIWRM